MSSARAAVSSRALASVRVVEARPVRPFSATRIEISRRSRVVF
jgi:hypothetical protein